MRHVVVALIVLSLHAVPALAGHDVGMSRIAAPLDTTRGRWHFSPWPWIQNTGDSTEDHIPVRCWIDSAGVRVYDSVTYTWAPLHPGNEMMVGGLPVWRFAPANLLYHITMFTDLANDSDRTNDTMRSTTYVKLADVRDELLWQWAEPAVDGYVGQYEWDFSQIADISDTAGRGGNPTPLGSCIFYYGDNVDDYAYFAFDVIAVKDLASCDSIVIKTDEDNDGQWETDSSEGAHTGYCDWAGDSIVFNWLPGTPCPGTMLASSFGSGNLQIEGAIPIGPRRGDLTVNPHDDLTGMAISCWHGDTCLGWWPQTLEMVNWDDPAQFGPASWYWWIGMQEPKKHAGVHPHADATLTSGTLFLPYSLLSPPSSLFSLDGRKVMDLKPGANDVSALSPGIYFVRSEPPTVSGQPAAVRKVIIAR